MKIANILQEMNSTSPPFQPKINSKVNEYKERLVSWNPVSVKKDAIFYQFTTGNVGGYVDIMPDACINVLFKCDERDPSGLFSGIFQERKELKLESKTTYFGFKPYSNLGMKLPNAKCSELADTHIDFKDIYTNSNHLLQSLSITKKFDERICAFMKFAEKNMIEQEYTPGFVDYFTLLICSSQGNVSLSDLGHEIGYSERYCREKFKNAYGVSPKRYSSMLRFQGALKALLTVEEDFSALAFDNGYFDQAHFIHDFKKFTSLSPYQFKKEYFMR